MAFKFARWSMLLSNVWSFYLAQNGAGYLCVVIQIFLISCGQIDHPRIRAESPGPARLRQSDMTS